MTAPTPDPDSLRYASHWEPVLAPPGRRLLDRLDLAPGTYLDIGAGTGGLALAAADRWPEARIIALDAAGGMLSVGQHRVATDRPAEAQRFEWLPADAADIPLADDSVDAATTCFTLQLVDDRLAVMREIVRVLRPGGIVGLVTWLAEDLILAADEVFDATLEELGLDPENGGFRPRRTTDYVSLDQARDELAAAGLGDVDVRLEELRHAWTRQEYLEFKEQFDERDLYEALEATARDRLNEAVRARWAALPDSAFTVQAPLVSAVAHRSER